MPSLLVTDVKWKLVPVCTIESLTFGTAPPVASTTLPVMVPVSAWGKAIETKPKTRASKAAQRLGCIYYPLKPQDGEKLAELFQLPWILSRWCPAQCDRWASVTGVS